MVKNPTREADKLAIYRHDRGVEPGSTENSTFVIRAGLGPATSGSEVRLPNNSAALPC